jgi:putative hydrolase of the HAD superfamily
MPITAVALDFDDTLAVATRDKREILREVVSVTRAPEITREEYTREHSNHLTAESRTPIFESILDDDADVDPAEIAAEYRRRLSESIEPVEGADRLLDTLAGAYRLGLLTNGPQIAQQAKVDQVGWGDRFDAVLPTGSLSAGKPDPRAFQAILAALDATPEETAYVGDSVEADIAGAARAGLKPVQVLVPDGPPPDDRAVAHVPRDELADRLPSVLAAL